MSNILRQQGYNTPRTTIPNWIVKVIAKFSNEVSLIVDRLDKVELLDCTNTYQTFNWKPQNIAHTIKQTAKFLDI